MSRLEELYRLRSFIAGEILREEQEHPEPTAQPKPVVDSELILKMSADLYGVSVEHVLAGGRERQVVCARQAACWLLRARRLSLPAVGRVLDLHHTTVLHACNKIDRTPSVRALLWPLLNEETVA